MRQCSECGEPKPDKDFKRKAKIKNTGTCWTCHNNRNRTYRAANKTHVNNLCRASKQRSRDANPEEFNKAKSKAYRKWYAKNRDKQVARAREYREANPDKVKATRLESKRRYESVNPDKVAARSITKNAIRRGELIREPCLVCGTTARIEAHHPHYCYPLNVIWLCKKHHGEVHRGQRRK